MNESDCATLAQHPTATIADAQDRFGVPTGIRPMWACARIAGPAFTVETRSGDNLFVHRALAAAPPGSAIVVNGFGDTSRALIGDLIVTTAIAKQLAGFVIDGAIRDIESLASMGMPIFAKGVSPAGPYKTGPGRLGVPVAIGGVVVVPNTDTADVLRRTEALIANEHTKRIANKQAAAN
ncbi:RraA family protein [Rhodococcoides fascians]|uniref:RraA family protein n=1 Tax=Rhodococcoides fascians TaxID=1828 RepID=UPI00068D396E|nr:MULTISPECIES: hypothetical protein [Rhodococcus]OZF01267.1 hypothetical protein CH301_10980 [Rhodococcus sp. 15-1189-1-1a]OZF15438.1 hypothetical protein CH299_11530 [Rhodococcus sp. 14-2686-1-2]